ncbi:hypothetical protein MMC20_002282 [Loxospora ochrophaea]|nr:hypothetical protein [Loxospora ochrophaea]
MAPWEETSPGRFERPFDSMERFFLALGRGSVSLNREHWSISIFAQFEMKGSTDKIESCLRHAWKTMRYNHPQIACIDCGNTTLYEVPDSAALDTWMNDTFIVASASTTKDDLLASFRPSAQTMLYYIPHNSEIIIHTSHWRIDFIGGLSLLHNLFTAIIKPYHIQFGNEGKNLSPSRDEAAKFSSPGTAESPSILEERSNAVTGLVMQLISSLPSMGFPIQIPAQIPGSTRRSEIVLNSRATSAIVSASKAHGLTVTTALHAALVVALQQIAHISHPSSSKYSTWGIFNIRPSLKSPYNDPTAYPMMSGIIGLPLTLQASTYTNLAAQLKQFYKQPVPPSAKSHIPEDIIIPFTNEVADLASCPPPPDLPLPSEPMLSSIGIVDSYLKRSYGDIIKVNDFWVGVEMNTPQIECYLWTWQGKMTLSACYNEAFYEKTLIQNFLQQVIDVLFVELKTEKV